MNQVDDFYQPSFHNSYDQQQPLHTQFVPQSPVSPSTPQNFSGPRPQQAQNLQQQQYYLQQQQQFQKQQQARYQQQQQQQQQLGNGNLSNANGAALRAAQQSQAVQPGQIGTPTTGAFSQDNLNAGPVLSPSSQSHPSSQQPGSQSPQKYPMAAPPLPASLQRQQSPQVGSNGSTPQPLSPSASSSAHAIRERERVAILLDINVELLQEMSNLHDGGKGGAVNQQQAAMMKSQGLPDKIASEEYIQACLRLQANLAYLYSQPDMQALNPQKQNQPSPNKGPSHPPPFMHPPPHMSSVLGDKYAALRKLFPGFPGRDAPSTTAPGSE